MATATKTKPAASEALVREFTVKKATPNAVQYIEELSPGETRGAIGSIYLLKSELAKMTNTARIRVTVEGVG